MLQKNRSILIVICGIAGSGKSTYGKRLAKQLKACYLDIDTQTQHVVQAGLKGMGMDSNDRDSPKYKEIFREAIHQCIFDVAKEQLHLIGLSCVIVAPFTNERKQKGFKQFIAQKSSIDEQNVFIVELKCSQEVIYQRIQKRGNVRDEYKIKNSEEFFNYADINNRDKDEDNYGYFVIDTSNNEVPNLTGPWNNGDIIE